MLNRKYYTFERNNYFYGKLLTSKDFQGEQDYMNSKRRFLNKTLHGSGIVNGMNVLIADDSSIVLQSGFALDAAGREIVVPETRVIKVSTIEGFEELLTDIAYLGIAYDQQERDPVYSVMGMEGDEEKGRRFNSIKESYRLYLLDEKECVEPEKDEDLYLKRQTLYEDEEILVLQTTPAYVTKGKHAVLKTEVIKKGYGTDPVSIQYQVIAEGFTNKVFEVRMEHLLLEHGRKAERESVLMPEEFLYGMGELSLRMSDIKISSAEQTHTVKKVYQTAITPVLHSALECVLENSYQDIMDAKLERTYDEKLFIAKLHLIKSGSTVLVDAIEAAPFGQYVYQAEQLMMLEKLKEYLVVPGEKKPDGGAAFLSSGQLSVHERGGSGRTHSSGTYDLSLGSGGENGKVFYSEEIMHGLGDGPVYVKLGVEYLIHGESGKAEREEVILGDQSIFANEDTRSEDKVYPIDSAVKILPDRGTFIIGVRPKIKTGKISIRLRWYAFKAEDLQQKVQKKEQNGCIMIQPDTIVLQPKETVHIHPVFINMPEEALNYSLLDVEGGKIENNGMYTAPAQEGVYEIRVSSISNPEIFTQAFAIVTQKKDEEKK